MAPVPKVCDLCLDVDSVRANRTPHQIWKDILQRTSIDPRPDRSDIDIMRHLVAARARTTHKNWVKDGRKRALSAWDLVTVRKNK
jgi:hypothetical protein